MSSKLKPEYWQSRHGVIACTCLLSVLSQSMVLNAAAKSETLSRARAESPSKKKTSASLTRAADSAATKENKAKADPFRLPGDVVPLEYELSFKPDLKTFLFAGDETVKINVLKPAKEIAMNSVSLKLSGAFLEKAGDDRQSVAGENSPVKMDIRLEPKTEKAFFAAKETLAPGTYKLHCHFDGNISSDLHGFYRAQYKDDSRQKRWLALTDLEPSDARRVFPCFDEPAFKAVFRVRATIDNSLVALSNSPVQKEEPSGAGGKTILFEPSPKMSTYLFALVVGDMKSSGEEISCNVPIKVWTVAGKEKLGAYALHEAAKILDFQTKYFATPYLGKKLDLIAIPEYSHNGMENVGAITFRESTILIDEKTGSDRHRLGIFGLLAHEMAHQWFGDLVTMKWWDDLWLNEAFATWMAYKITQSLHPEWRFMMQSVANYRNVMFLDSLRSTRAIRANVSSLSDAKEMFDSITYRKGSAVLRMLEAYVGEKAFQQGITTYLKRHAFGNAEAGDLWTAIGAAAPNIPVSQIMHSFVLQKGYPQVDVKVSPDSTKMFCSQHRKLAIGEDRQDPSLWDVPLMIRRLTETEPDSGSRIQRQLFTRQEQQLEPGKGKGPLFVNAGGTGYYSTCYDHKEFVELQSNYERLLPEEKLVFLSDCESLVLPGSVPVEDYLRFVHRLGVERDPWILNELLKIPVRPFEMMTNAQDQTSYQRWVRSMVLPIKTRLDGWNQKPDDSLPTRELRASVLTLLGTYGQDKKTIEEAFLQFAGYLKDKSSVSPDLVPSVLSAITFNGGPKEYDELLEFLKTANDPSDHERVLSYLPRFHQKDLAARTLAMAMGNDLRGSEGLGLIMGVAANYFTQEFGWKFIKENWDRIMKKFPEQQLHALASVGSNFDTPDRERDVIAWHTAHPVPSTRSETARMLESLHMKVLFRQRYAERIRNFVNFEAGKISADSFSGTGK